MSGSLSNNAENLILKWLFTTNSVTRPSARHCALHTSAPGENGTGGEAALLGRKSVTFGAPSNGQTLNSNSFSFTAAVGVSLTATHWSLWDASSGGSCLGWGTLKKATHFGSVIQNEKIQQQPSVRTFAAGDLICVARDVTLFAKHLALNWLFRSAAVTRPTQWWMAVHYRPPADTGIGGELAGSGAARQQINFTTPTQGVIANDADLFFGPAVGGWPRLTHYSIWDSSIGGNCLQVGILKAPYDVIDAQRLRFAAGKLKISVN